MSKVARFWRGLADALECAECGAFDWSITRRNYEKYGDGTCESCGVQMRYTRTSRSVPDAVRGAVVPESIPTSAEHRGELRSEGQR